MRTLVTGATGFLGVNLCQHLTAAGAQTRALARTPERAQALSTLGVEVVAGDVTDEASLARALADVDVVYHLAGKLFIPGVPAEEYQAIHEQGTRNVLRQARAHGVKRFVHCSTTGVFGVTGARPANEDAPYAPTNAYERTKLQGEAQTRAAMREGFPAVIIRPGLVYGPGDLHLLGFFHSIQRGVFRPIGRAPVWLHPVYIDDMSAAMARAAEAPEAVGEAFNIAGTQPVTLRTLAQEIAKSLGVTEPRGWIPLPLAQAVALAGDALPASLRHRAPLTTSRLDFLTHSRMYDVSKAQRLLGFSAETPLTAGLAETARWYRSEGLL
ncbi:MAG: SDR family NAD(P)-dependent oxidoreductase [Chloroflexota bacterium]|nr:SDR family NAD(P)-dependent oxidoreductase [Chloroflexota bacterium]